MFAFDGGPVGCRSRTRAEFRRVTSWGDSRLWVSWATFAHWNRRRSSGRSQSGPHDCRRRQSDRGGRLKLLSATAEPVEAASQLTANTTITIIRVFTESSLLIWIDRPVGSVGSGPKAIHSQLSPARNPTEVAQGKFPATHFRSGSTCGPCRYWTAGDTPSRRRLPHRSFERSR